MQMVEDIRIDSRETERYMISRDLRRFLYGQLKVKPYPGTTTNAKNNVIVVQASCVTMRAADRGLRESLRGCPYLQPGS